MKFDYILLEIGVFGKYQKVVGTLLYLCAIPLVWHAIAQVFLAAKTDHWCAIPEDQSLNCSNSGFDPQSEANCLELQKRLTIPSTINEDGNIVYSKCERYANARSLNLDGSFDWDATDNDIISCDAGWEYDRSQYKTTVIQDFDLVCSREDLPGLAQSVFFAGFLCGSFVWGTVADWAGRRVTFFISLAFSCIACTATSFVPSFAAFTAVRFFVAAANYGVFLMAFVLVSEIVGPAYRTLVGTLMSVCFALGYVLLSFMAYMIREWRHFQLALSVPVFVFFTFLIFLPESPRWLISKKKFKQAEKMISKMAKINGTRVPENMFDEQDQEQPEEKKNTKKNITRQPTHIDLFRTPNLRKKSLNILFNWFVNGLVYYGLSLSTSSLGIDAYIAAFVSGAVDIPGFLTSWFAMQRWGRRPSLCIYLVLAGVACLITTLISPGIERAAVAMVGKFAVSGSFNIIYTYSAELYPTPVRSMGIGMSSMSARLSGVVAPFILILGKHWEPLPLVLFGGSAVLAGALTLLLPETLNHNLPETIADGERFGKDKGFQLKALVRKASEAEASDSDKDFNQIAADEHMEVEDKPTAV